MARGNNGRYWAERMRTLSEALLDKSYDYARYIEGRYARAEAEVEKEIAVWYRRFATNNDISLAEAKRLLTTRELAEFRWTVQEYIRRGMENAFDGRWMKELENASARVHISRLEALKLQIRQRAEALYAEQARGLWTLSEDVYSLGYYHTAYELQKGVGVGWGLHRIDQERLDKILARSWTSDGLTFRDRCWTNKEALVRKVETVLPQMMIRGAAPDWAIREIAQAFGVSRRKAGRLVMTESAYFSSVAQRDCFKDLGVERYRVVAAFDRSTCELCGDLDGAVFKMGEFQVGVTAPPFHPWCRCCTAPYFEDLEGVGTRAARGLDGKTRHIPADTSFKDWKRSFVD